MIRAFALLAVLVLGAGCVSGSPEPTATAVPTLPLIATPSPTVSPTPTPVIPTQRPTLAPTPTQTPTQTPSNAPTPTVRATPTRDATPTAAPNETAPADPTATATTSGNLLDPNGEPTFEAIEITTGFTPDPMTRDVVAGGGIDAAYLKGDCSGFVNAPPDYSVRYTVDGFPSLLRFYFEGQDTDDATLVVREPDGNWLCNDDSYSSRNPTVDINNPGAGRYAIWIGSVKSGDVSGTFSITELESNRP